MMDVKLEIPLNGLAAGESRFSWHASKEFFESFENSEIFDADLDIAAIVQKSGRNVLVDCDVRGSVTVECDRCLEDLVMPVDVSIAVKVRFGESGESEESEENGRELISLAADDSELDLGQIVYDYVCLSLPMQRVHKDGECNPDTVRFMGVGEAGDVSGDDEDNNPFAALKGLL
ncbi:MAG: YceD family protein [Candidatus Cryptobacteroides sp.]